MFWWLYYTTNANVSSYYDKPLIIWLQGGPGASSTSYGNFEELGPLDADLRPRNFSWVKDYNILFIDNPIGTGFSYATLSSGFAKTNAEIARDLVECMKGFLKALPGFQDVPTYITTESYGGKMGAEFALQWYKGMVDTEGYKKIDDVAQKTKNAVETNSWKTATMLWMNAEAVVAEVTDNIDFYNILTRMEASGTRFCDFFDILEYATFNDASLTRLMNGPVKEALQLSIVHSAQSNMVFTKLQEDFMKPVINIVEELLSETDLKVAVITGHMDLIVDTPGTLNWVEKMNWKNANLWHYSPRYPIVVQEIIEGYEKSYGNFAMYWVNRAGHMVPKDNPAAMGRILQKFTGQ
ncbi:retinoid-inducible serine carboxypeptidase [Apis mellifera carnica]|nr:retinoid-inducible serine carboxypeptidase [Apis mellifera carnica]